MTPITRFNILATALAGLILALSISYFFIFLPYKEYSERTAKLRQQYIAEEKQSIKRETQRVIKELEFLHSDHLQEVLTHLQMNVLDMKALIESQPDESLKQIHSRVAHLRRDFDQLHHSAYLVFDAEGNLLSRCSTAHLLELGMDPDLSTAEIKKLTKPLLESSPNKRVEILWPSSGGDAELEVHALYNPALNNGLQIVAMLPKQICERFLQRRFLERLSHVRFGPDASGYFYIFNAEGKPVMSQIFSPPFNADLSPHEIEGEKLLLAKRMVKSAVNGGGYVEYNFKNPAKNHNIENKIAYNIQLPYWNWVLGTGIYTSALDQRIKAHNRDLLTDTHRRARIGIIVVLINLFLGFVIAYITNRYVRRIEAKREHHLKQLQQYSDLLDELCLVSKGDLEGNITYANDKFCEVSGYTREEMLGHPHNIVRHPSVPKSVFKRMWQRIQAGKSWRGISRNRTKNGDSYYADSVIMPLTDQDGNIVEYIAARYEITELLEKRDEVKLAFATDKLTSLGSRHKLVLDISSASEEMCLLLFDIVDFGGINHNLGTEAADLALQHFSNQLVEFFAAEGSSLYRLHSDLFAVLTESNQVQEIIATIERFYEFLREHPFSHAEVEQLNLTAISGVACGEKDLLTCADAALQHAKHNKQAVAIYDPEIANQQGRMRAYWINEVQQALLDQRLIPHYQPIVHIPSGRITRYEALMRMQNSQGELISPGAFLPIMEQTSHYPEMTRAIFRQACMFFRYRSEYFSVNLSVDDLLRRDTVDSIASMAKSYAVTDRLVLELVETENIHNYDVALNALVELKSMGIKIAIDDFGSGFANFSYLSAFPADFVKIDGSLIKKINKDEKTRNLVKILIEYAHSEGMEVIAEFVSSVEIFDTIRAMGCDYAQGFYFGAPVPGDKIKP